MGLFLSTFINKVDSKGRVSVPATFRAALKEQEFQGVVLYPSFTDPCVEGCGMDFLERLSAGLETLPAFSAERGKLNRLVFARSVQLPYDQTGRIVLPAKLMERAGITTEAAFVGLGKTFQLWQPDRHAAYEADLEAAALADPPSAPALADVAPRGASS
ncbi:division/cell wall cluster transcriptional repressor MraZ [Roseospira goensis]|uniref:Transcriptional regulator MraZ n=1 Tax=Roseospira goensis TaxID=391922 RepID=A0A7W6S0U8_9PROT|nr:division/cell wall cluster transcriptional repressor MraZ [Roseospira goensis]MBB4286642.1 MraZ protein [Roseospira goensis]